MKRSDLRHVPNPRPVCRLIGTDGNAFSIIGRVARALRAAGELDAATEFVQVATRRGASYDELLALALIYTEVE